MSERQGPGETPGGYRRSSSGLVGAMIATVLVVIGFVAIRGLNRETPDVTPQSVDWRISLRAAQDDGRLQALAPPELPAGWRATSASYDPGEEPQWRLGLLTEDQKFVGVHVTTGSLDSLVREEVDEDADSGSPVTVGGAQWQVFTDSGGDYGLGRTITPAGQPRQAQLVVGSAPAAQIRAFTASLR